MHTAIGSRDIYIAKLNNQGNFIWGETIGNGNAFIYNVPGPVSAYNVASAMDVDSNGNVYIGRCFRITMDFDPTAGTDIRNSKGAADSFLVRFNANGTYDWVKTLSNNATGDDCINSVYAANNGPVYVTGNNFSPTTGQEDLFVAAFTPTAGYDPIPVPAGMVLSNTSSDYLTLSQRLYLQANFSGNPSPDSNPLVVLKINNQTEVSANISQFGILFPGFYYLLTAQSSIYLDFNTSTLYYNKASSNPGDSISVAFSIGDKAATAVVNVKQLAQ